MLGRGGDEHRAVLSCFGPGGVSLEIEMLLATQLEFALQRERRAAQAVIDCAAPDEVRLVMETTGRERLPNTQNERPRFVSNHHCFRCCPASFRRFAYDQGTDLTMIKN